MDTDYSGELYLSDELITGQSSNNLARLRNEKIGFVFQFHYLLAEFTVLENVMLPAKKLGVKTMEEIKFDAMSKLKLLDIEDQAHKITSRLSGGQKQRVAIARALINNPSIIMGDEPTGNLDSKNAQIVFDIFKELTEKEKMSLLIVTHDVDFANKTDRIIHMEDGKIIS
jgi:lipoprotein-releasing system ATP-binding protein